MLHLVLTVAGCRTGNLKKKKTTTTTKQTNKNKDKLRLLGRILEVKQNERGSFASRVTPESKSAVLETPIEMTVVLEAPRLHESS